MLDKIISSGNLLSFNPAHEFNFYTEKKKHDKFLNDLIKKKIKTRHNIQVNQKAANQLSEYINFLKNIYNKSNTNGKILLYPMGGIDPVPFFFKKTINNIVAISLEELGAVNGIAAYYANDIRFVFWRYQQFDFLPYFENILSKPGVTGMLPVLLLRIKYFFNADIQGVYYFDITKDGDMEFADKKQNKECNGKNALVIFIDETGIERRYWYIKEDLLKDSSSFKRYIENIPVSTVLLKASYDILKGPITENTNLYYIFDKIKKNRGTVIADRQMKEKSYYSLFDDVHKRYRYLLGQDESFGYSKPGEYVYFGKY